MGVELAPVEGMLDEIHDSLPVHRDQNAYTLGRLGEHNVVVAVMPTIGNSAAATVATQLLNDFPSVRFGLLVGTGGGVPGDADVRLGDVVVSQSTDTFGGVVQYDMGKTLEGGGFQRTGLLNAPPAVLSAHVRKLEARHRRLGNKLSLYVSRMVDRYPVMRSTYSLPVKAEDHLFLTEYIHQSGPDCDACDKLQTTQRATRANNKSKIHYGTIGSANLEISDATVRNELAQDMDLLCVEMEAAGLMNNLPCLVIRGICDYADSHKNKEWQPYAAAIAAAYTKELLMTIPVQEVADTPIRRALDQLKIKLDLDKIPHARGAIFNSSDSLHRLCHKATRVDLLRSIQNWIRLPHGKTIFWLSGVAGIGKSTVSWTIANWLQDQKAQGDVCLGASFFFKRGEGDRGSAAWFFPTLVRQLVVSLPQLSPIVAGVVESDPLIFDKAIGEQFDKLIFKPLQTLSSESITCPTLVIVVDALDECDNETDIKTILQLWSKLPQITALNLRLFLTSRPELPIRLGFARMSKEYHLDVILQDAVPQQTIEQDLLVYLRDEFCRIREEHCDSLPFLMPLSDAWPDDGDLYSLVKIAEPLFIVASTIVRFVGDQLFDPQERLEMFMKNQKTGHMSKMEQTYLPVLLQLTSNLGERGEAEQVYEDFRKTVGAIICLAEPLSVNSLASLLGLKEKTVWYRLNPLHSVLQIPSDSNTAVRSFHLSFAEFLLDDQNRNQPFHVDEQATHLALRNCCLKLLSSAEYGLRENICKLEYPGKLRREIDPVQIAIALSPAVQYACRYWVYHVQQSRYEIDDKDEVCSFLKEHLLHWLEALSLMGRLSDAVGFVSTLQSAVSVSANYEYRLTKQGELTCKVG